MSKNKKTKTVKKTKNTKKIAKVEFNPQKDHLETLIELTERNIRNDGSGADDYLVNQLRRLKGLLTNLS